MDSRLSHRPTISSPNPDEAFGLYWPVLREQQLRLDDDCEILPPEPAPAAASRPANESPAGLSQMTTEVIENELRAARQVIADSTTQRNVVLEFLLHLQTAQRELATETELVTRQLPSLRFRVARNSNEPFSESGVSTLSVNSLQVSVLSRLTRLSQRTREVMEDLDRRRNAVGMVALNPIDSSSAHETQKTDQNGLEPVQNLKPMRKVRLEERLLVEWSPNDSHPCEARLPSCFEAKQVVVRSSDRELISR